MNYEFDSNKEHIFGIKSEIIWETHNSRSRAMVYLRKPKNVTEEEYRDFLRSVTITIPKEYLDKREKIRNEEMNK